MIALFAFVSLGLFAGLILDATDDDQDPSAEGEDLSGTEEGDVLTGTDLDDTIHGGDGSDAITGGGGDDWLRGGSDQDVLIGEEGNDSITGSLGADWLQGDQGQDTLNGGFGGDGLYGGEGSDIMLGGAGDDVLSGVVMYEIAEDQAADALEDIQDGFGVRMTPYFSSVSDDGDSDTLLGGDGHDTLIAGDGDILTGGGGSNDFITGAWAQGNDLAVITDFDLDEDAVLYYYPESEEAPDLTVTSEENGSGGQDSTLYADGVSIMRINDTDGLFSVDVHVRLRATAAEI